MSSRFCHPKDRSFPPGEFHENLCFQKSQMGSNVFMKEGRTLFSKCLFQSIKAVKNYCCIVIFSLLSFIYTST